MKICLIAPLFDPWLVGGAERYAKTLAERLSEKHDVTVITLQGPTKRKVLQINKNLRIIEIKSYNVSQLYDLILNDDTTSFIKKTIWHLFDTWNILQYFKIKKILKKIRPDIIHTNGMKGFSPSLLYLLSQLKIPHIHTIHDYEFLSRWTGLYRNEKPITQFNLLDNLYISFLRTLSSNIDAVISPSRFTLLLHEKHGYFLNSKKYIIPNGTKIMINKPKKKFNPEFLFLGQITSNKGPHIAVNAFKQIKNNDVKLHIVGRGPFLEKLKIIAANDMRIKFHGFISDEELENIFSRSSYVIMPSLWFENFPLVINQVMSHGIPVIASNIGGIPELVKNSYNGFLFEPGNVESLKKIIEAIIRDSSSFSVLSQNAFESSKKFTMEDQMESIFKIYSSVIKHRNL